jgi:hypothetical protein
VLKNKEVILSQALQESWDKRAGGGGDNLVPESPRRNGEIQDGPMKDQWGRGSTLSQGSGTSQKHRKVENVKNWPRSVKSVFYDVVRGLNQYDRERKGSFSPLNGEIAGEIAWSEYDRDKGGQHGKKIKE